jgi:hypothetical protein
MMNRRSVLRRAGAASLGLIATTAALGCDAGGKTQMAAEPHDEKSFGERALYPAGGPSSPQAKKIAKDKADAEAEAK